MPSAPRGGPTAAAFRQSAWDSAKNGLLRELMDVDHAAARLLSSQAEVDVETARVDLNLIYDAGPRYRYGENRILGLQRYQESLVERYNQRLRTGSVWCCDLVGNTALRTCHGDGSVSGSSVVTSWYSISNSTMSSYAL